MSAHFKYATLAGKRYRIIPMDDWPAVKELLQFAGKAHSGGRLIEHVECQSCGAYLDEDDTGYPHLAHKPDCIAVKYTKED